MADEKAEAKPQEKPAEAPAENKDNKEKAGKSKSGSLITMIIVGVIVLVAAGAGIGLSRLFAGSSKSPSAEEATAQKEAPAEKETAKPAAEKGEKPKSEKPAAKNSEKSKGESSKSEKAGAKEGEAWYFNLDPVVANLDEPGATRYIRSAFILEMSPELNAEKGTALLDQKKPLIANLLTIYLAGLNIETTRGDKNLKRIQLELCDTFNEQLFPESKPMVKRVLIKEFAVQ
jgi:flagellar basal body-associated protein FliL